MTTTGILTNPTFKPTIHKDVQGVEMGILDNGTPYVTARGLARFCGVSPSVIITLSAEWGDNPNRPRNQKILTLLSEREIYSPESLYTPIEVDGTTHHAYTEQYAMSILEYYAFEANDISHHARNIFRKLARNSLREFIYTCIGYDPNNNVPPEWQQFHDRLTLNSSPANYFSVFMEMSDMVLAAIRHGLTVDSHTIPDISVGLIWSRYWNKQNLDEKYGKRVKSIHEYPDYFPQAEKGPVEAWVYPLEALGEFRLWMQNIYLPEKLPNYLKNKVKQGQLQATSIAPILTALNVPVIAP